MREGPDNNVWIWKQPLTENEYVISADVSRGDAKDYSTFHVIDVNSSEVVAVPSPMHAKAAVCICRFRANDDIRNNGSCVQYCRCCT